MRYQIRRDTAANWSAANPVLLAGEQALETDTGVEKIGDGTTAYNSLPVRQSGAFVQIGKSYFRPPVVKTGAYTAAAGDFVLADGTGGGFTVTLPASPEASDAVCVKKVDATSAVITVAATGKTIDTDSTASVVSKGAGAVFVYDGTNWQIESIMRAGTATIEDRSVTWAKLSRVPAARRDVLAGEYIRSVGGVIANTTTPTVGTEVCLPFMVPRGMKITGLFVTCGTGSAGAVLRLGVRSDVNGLPGGLVADLGTVDASTAGGKSLTGLSVTSSADDGLIWITATAQVASGAVYHMYQYGGQQNVTDFFNPGGWQQWPSQTGVTGALPAGALSRSGGSTSAVGVYASVAAI